MTSAVEVMAGAISSVNDEYNLSRDQAEAALSAIDAAGFVLVPKELTDGMIYMGMNAYELIGGSGFAINTAEDHVAFIYEALISAARSIP